VTALIDPRLACAFSSGAAHWTPSADMLRTRHTAAVRTPDDVSQNLNAIMIAGPG
jgi:hypothetical protein